MVSRDAGHYNSPHYGIGAGGMGEVYRARDERLGRHVAVKVLPEDLANTPELRQRFECEAKVLASLNHPNICTIYGLGEQEGRSFIALEPVRDWLGADH